MHRATLVLSSLVCLAGTAHADAKTPELSSTKCGLSTPYNVQVDGGGVWLYRHDGAPKEIFFHDGTLSVDLSTLHWHMPEPRTQMLVLGTVHLSGMPKGFKPESPEPVLEKPAAFKTSTLPSSSRQ